MVNIKFSDLENLEITTQIVGEFGMGVHKTIDLVARVGNKRVWFNIHNCGKVVGSVPDLKEAIDLYNNL